MKPLYKWSGGKRNEIRLFRNHYPTSFTRIVEPFFGAGAVTLDLVDDGPSVKAHVNDIHDEVVAFWKVLKANPTGLRAELSSLCFVNEEKAYYRIRDEYNFSTPVKKAARFFYLRKMAYRGMLRYNQSGHFNIPYGRYKTEFTFDEIFNSDLVRAMHYMRISQGDFEVVMKQYASDPDAFIFLDPPYDSTFTNYKTEFSQEDHERLAATMKSSKAKCLQVIGGSNFIRALYHGMVVDEYEKKYAFKIHSGRVKTGAKHLIVRNW